MNPKVVAQKFKELGNDAYRKKDYAKALKNYGKAIELEPNEIAFYNNSAAAYLEMKNYDECIKFCQQACEIGKKNRAELKFIFKGFRRMGQAYEEMENPKMAKVVFEEAKVFVEKAQKKNDKSECEKFLSEIEVAMERCQIKEGLYKVIEIKGKGMGCIALEDIEPGTLIVKDKIKCFSKIHISDVDVKRDVNSPCKHLCSMLDSFFAMEKNDQEEFFTLHNKYSDLTSLSDDDKDKYSSWKRFAEASEEKYPCLHADCVLKVICIFFSNSLNVGVGIKISRFNHSCSPNAEHSVCISGYNPDGTGNGQGVVQIRATSKIKKGEEICRTYFSGLNIMRNRKERQEDLLKSDQFLCTCERCQDEEINNDDETYEKFKKLLQGAEKRGKIAKNLLNWDNEKSLDFMEKAISCQKQMYNLAEKKKTTKGFITAVIIPEWWYLEINRYGIAHQCVYERGIREFVVKMEYFKGECLKLAKIVYEMELTVNGKNSKDAIKWKERYEDFDNWCKKNCK